MNKNKNLLINSKGFQALNKLGMLANMFYILRENYNDLIFEIDSIQNSSDAYMLTFENKSLSKMLFNFLSSTSALIDCCRNTLKSYEGTDLEAKYFNKRENLFVKNSCANFIKDFRNYQLHYAVYIPFMSDKNEIILIVEDLMKYNKWTSLSMQLLKNCGEEIVLKSICEEYYMLIDNFYDWLYSEFLEYHRKDFAETKKYIEKTGNQWLINFYTSIINSKNLNLKI